MLRIPQGKQKKEIKMSSDRKKIIEEIKSKYPQKLFLIEIPGDDTLYIARECSWSEFAPFVQTDNPSPDILSSLVKAFLVYPKIDEQDFEYNTSGHWPPGKIITLAQKIQEALGYSERAVVKTLGN